MLLSFSFLYMPCKQIRKLQIVVYLSSFTLPAQKGGYGNLKFWKLRRRTKNDKLQVCPCLGFLQQTIFRSNKKKIKKVTFIFFSTAMIKLKLSKSISSQMKISITQQLFDDDTCRCDKSGLTKIYLVNDCQFIILHAYTDLSSPRSKFNWVLFRCQCFSSR